ncbi:hypothetical protein ACLOJK_032327 [Asimina triloba]
MALVPTSPTDIESLVDEIVEEFREWIHRLQGANSRPVSAATSPAASTPSVEALERVRFQGRNSREEEARCAICLNDSTVGTEVARLPCKHIFHSECILRWLSMHHICPLCRFELPRQME